MAAPQALAGWRAIIKFNNQVFAAGFVLDYSIDTNFTELQGIDNVFPDEMAPESIKVSMNLKVYRTPDNDPVVLKIAPGGDSVDGGAITAQETFTTSKYITIEIRDKVSDTVVLYLPKAVLVKRTGGGDAENLITESWTIKSIGYFGPGAQRSTLL